MGWHSSGKILILLEPSINSALMSRARARALARAAPRRPHRQVTKNRTRSVPYEGLHDKQCKFLKITRLEISTALSAKSCFS